MADEVEYTPDPRVDYPVMTAERFPHGLRCATCHRLIEDGRPFKASPYAIAENGDTFSSLTCVYCDDQEQP